MCIRLALAVSLLMSTIDLSIGADYPNRPLRMLIGFAPGGSIDVTARAIAQPLSEALHQQVVVDNRAGASGNIATEMASRSAPDGYTMLMGTIAALAVNPSIYPNLPFDPVRDFEAVTLAVSSTNVLASHATLPIRTVRDLIALAKTQPHKLTYGSSGIGGAGHLAGVLFETMAEIGMVHVPYKGGAPAMIAILSGEVNLVFATEGTLVPQIKAGKIRPLGVTMTRRSTMLPEIPTIAEAGLPGYEANNWYGLVLPARTPRQIIERLNREVVRILQLPAIKDQLLRQGLEATPTTAQEFSAYIRSETEKWAKVVKAAGVKPE